MQATFIAARRFGVALYMLLTLGQGALLSTGVQAWADSWWLYRGRIISLAVVNVAITTGNEIVSRSVFSSLASEHGDQSFLIEEPSGSTRIHRQSAINILMTLFASLMGGPVYFFKRRSARYLFFIGFGLLNSALCQTLTSWMSSAGGGIHGARLGFDLFYNGTVKYLIFEAFRPALLGVHLGWLGTGVLRVGQDFFTSLIKVFFLNEMGFKG